ncbi:transposase [Syntrophomonas zehnderi]|nr:transposase [Syntrophomonas zehnderi]
MYDRSLLSELSRCAWKVLSLYLKQGVSLDDPEPGAVIAVQTFGDFLNFNPHLHIIATDGCFTRDGEFMIGIAPDASSLIDLFRLEVFRMLAALCHPWHRCTSPSMDVGKGGEDRRRHY